MRNKQRKDEIMSSNTAAAPLSSGDNVLDIPDRFRRKKGEYGPIGEIPIDEIKVGERFRKELGDLAQLANSIKKVGLLQPIVLNGRNELIAGQRRLEAVRRLGWNSIPFRVTDVPSILLAEHDENEVRKNFTLTEREAIATALEAEIKGRQGKRTDLDPFKRKLKQDATDELVKLTSGPAPRSSKPSDRIAKAAGFSSRRQRQRVKKVMANGTPALVAAMDAETIDVTAADKIAQQPEQEQDRLLEEAVQPKPRKAQSLSALVVDLAVKVEVVVDQFDIAAIGSGTDRTDLMSIDCDLTDAEKAILALRRQVRRAMKSSN